MYWWGNQVTESPTLTPEPANSRWLQWGAGLQQKATLISGGDANTIPGCRNLGNPTTEVNHRHVCYREVPSYWRLLKDSRTIQPMRDTGSKTLCRSVATTTVSTWHKSHHLHQARCPIDQGNLPAEGPEPGQVIGVVHIVANSDYLMETLNLDTHHLKNREIPELFLGSSLAFSSHDIEEMFPSYTDAAFLLFSHTTKGNTALYLHQSQLLIAKCIALMSWLTLNSRTFQDSSQSSSHFNLAHIHGGWGETTHSSALLSCHHLGPSVCKGCKCWLGFCPPDTN